jgi:hypothetical protein
MHVAIASALAFVVGFLVGGALAVLADRRSDL